jgi:predicted choloylglycine hydrolase
MKSYQKRFRAVSEDYPGEKWRQFFDETCHSYQQWFLKQGELNRPNYLQCRTALDTYMPELVPMWDHLVKLAGGGDLEARLLSLYCPTPYLSGCSQAVWTRYNPILVRNYDYDPTLSEGMILKSNWHGTQVIASTDCLWGVLDGMNEHGLIVSLSFGGREEIGEGFGIPLILRYILEFCKTTEEAVWVLCRIPTHMAYNVTLLDATYQVTTVEVSPTNPPVISHKPLAVNHQGDFELTNYAVFSKSYQRHQALIEKLHDPYISIESFIHAFEYAPLWASNYDEGFGTLYTAVYNPTLRAMEYRWPYQMRMYQSFAYFEERDFWVMY